MNNTLNQTYKDLSISYFKEVFDLIDEVISVYDYPYYLIGANAIALELLKEGVKPSRGTKDIDFAVMLSSLAEYDTILKQLINKGFVKVKAPCTIRHPQYDVVVDILPFGEVVQKDTESFLERKVDLHILSLGFEEILEHPKQVQIEKKVANIPPLCGMVILKLIAWNDRPEDRDSDLKDILTIIQQYFDYQSDEIYNNHLDLFEETEPDFLKIGSRVLGREASIFLQKNEVLSTRIFAILKANLGQAENSMIAKAWAQQLDKEVEYCFLVLQEFQKGLIEMSDNN